VFSSVYIFQRTWYFISPLLLYEVIETPPPFKNMSRGTEVFYWLVPFRSVPFPLPHEVFNLWKWCLNRTCLYKHLETHLCLGRKSLNAIKFKRRTYYGDHILGAAVITRHLILSIYFPCLKALFLSYTALLTRFVKKKVFFRTLWLVGEMHGRNCLDSKGLALWLPAFKPRGFSNAKGDETAGWWGGW